jgi:hypothetical protein
MDIAGFVIDVLQLKICHAISHHLIAPIGNPHNLKSIHRIVRQLISTICYEDNSIIVDLNAKWYCPSLQVASIGPNLRLGIRL